MVTLMYKNTHTHKTKTVQSKNKTNKQPPPPHKKKTTFRVLIESVTGCKDSIPIFLFEEKKKGI